jgi:hypothetical protein
MRQGIEKINNSMHCHIIEVVFQTIVGTHGLDEVDFIEMSLLIDHKYDVLTL